MKMLNHMQYHEVAKRNERKFENQKQSKEMQSGNAETL